MFWTGLIVDWVDAALHDRLVRLGVWREMLPGEHQLSFSCTESVGRPAVLCSQPFSVSCRPFEVVER